MKPSEIKNVSDKERWNRVSVQVHMDPPLIPLIKSKNDYKSDKNCVKIKLRKDPTSAKSNIYEFKKALFDQVDPDDFLLFIRKIVNES